MLVTISRAAAEPVGVEAMFSGRPSAWMAIARDLGG